MNRLGQLGRMSRLNGNVSVRKRILPETKAYIAAMTVQPASDITSVYNSLIKSLITSGIWEKLACLELYYTAHTEQAGLLNLIIPAQTGLAVNGVSWAVKQGYTTDPGKYIRTGFIPTDAGAKYRRNDACMGYIAHQSPVPPTNGWYDIGLTTDLGLRIKLYGCADGRLGLRLNATGDYTAPAGSITANTRYIAVTRERSTHVRLIIDDSYGLEQSNASANIGTIAGDMKDIVLGGTNNNGDFENAKTMRPAVFFAGLHLTAGEWASFKGAIAVYLAEMGAI